MYISTNMEAPPAASTSNSLLGICKWNGPFYAIATTSILVLVVAVIYLSSFYEAAFTKKKKDMSTWVDEKEYKNRALCCDPHDMLRQSSARRKSHSFPFNALFDVSCCVTYNKDIQKSGYTVVRVDPCEKKDEEEGDEEEALKMMLSLSEIQSAVIEATGIMKQIICVNNDEEEEKQVMMQPGASYSGGDNQNNDVLFWAITMQGSRLASFQIFKRGNMNQVHIGPREILIVEVSRDVLLRRTPVENTGDGDSSITGGNNEDDAVRVQKFVMRSGCGLRLISCRGSTWPAQ